MMEGFLVLLIILEMVNPLLIFMDRGHLNQFRLKNLLLNGKKVNLIVVLLIDMIIILKVICMLRAILLRILQVEMVKTFLVVMC